MLEDTSSFKSPSIVVSNAKTDLLRLLPDVAVLYSPFTSVAEKPAVVPTSVYPVMDFEEPNERFESSPSSLQSISSRSGTGVMVPVPGPKETVIWLTYPVQASSASILIPTYSLFAIPTVPKVTLFVAFKLESKLTSPLNEASAPSLSLYESKTKSELISSHPVSLVPFVGNFYKNPQPCCIKRCS